MNGEEFIIEDGVLKEYKGAEEDVEIPGGVTKIGRMAFRGNENLRRIKIPGGIKEILTAAFDSCKELEEIEFSQGIESIGMGAFYGCESLKKVEFPEGMLWIDDNAFAKCRNLKLVVIPKSLRYIHLNALGSLAPSCEVIFEGSPDWKESRRGFEPLDETLRIWAKNEDISKITVRLRNAAVRGFASHYLAGDEMPAAVKESALKYMARHSEDLLADRDCLAVMLQEKLIPAKKLPACMDAAAKLEKPELTAMLLEYQNKNFTQEAVQGAADKALERELNRTEPTVKELEKIWSFRYAGKGRGVTSYKGEERRIDVPEKIGKEKVTEICEYAFSPLRVRGHASPKNQEARNAIEEIFLPGSVRRICGHAFSGCSSLKRVHIPEQTTEIDIWAFSDNSPELTICAPEGSYAQKYVRERPALGQGAIGFEKEGAVKKERFRKYNGESPEFVMENGTLLRYMGAGIDVKVPDGVEVIGEGAFSGCGSLRSAELPETTRTIKANAFYGVNPACEIVINGCASIHSEASRNPLEDVLCIWAKKMGPSALPRELRKKAVKGFARHFAEAGEMSERVKENYIQYMKKNCQKLWMDEDCLRVILQENYITAGNIGAYLDEAERLG